MQVICISNNKGGTGKTTSTLCIGHALARIGNRVLLIDCDPQSNLTKSFDVLTTHHLDVVIDGRGSLADIARNVSPCLDLVPATPSIAGAEKVLGSRPEYPFFFRDALLKANYDFVLFDTAPTLSPLTIAALGASDAVFVPAQPDFFGYTGLVTLLDMVARIRANFNPKLRVGGVFFNKHHPSYRRKLHHQYVESMAEDADLKDLLMQTYIRENVALSEAQANGQSIFEWAPQSNGAADYEALTTEMIARLSVVS
ncbi:ParA family protein [Hymenobacter glacieicola]|uniref:Sporulation initiation inhibitor Soj n=1 Tax=Hymenobacter glacieicola TaxID=1562124 RepID=A0ABQ1X8F5_9BACT|nr:ParA family protein [Hymenobacter glacieicola]GGG61325.1 sporulation initiation inhibitor Soj [Hymenobacter glacieicola]